MRNNCQINRRKFLQAGAASVGCALTNGLWADDEVLHDVITVTGPLPAAQLGVTLPHERVLVDFVGADQISPDRYDPDEVVPVVLPHLQRLRELGCRTLVECTPAYLGRDPLLLKRLAEASGLQILTNTGYYGAGQGMFLPAHAREETADQLAARWLAEWRDGIDGSGIRPGFIKIGMDAGPLNKINRKLIQAAARTHKASGLSIAAHTGDGTAALEQLQVLKAEGAQVLDEFHVPIEAVGRNPVELDPCALLCRLPRRRRQLDGAHDRRPHSQPEEEARRPSRPHRDGPRRRLPLPGRRAPARLTRARWSPVASVQSAPAQPG